MPRNLKREKKYVYIEREGDLCREKWAKISSFHLILQQIGVVNL
jgi:hypothetical protein